MYGLGSPTSPTANGTLPTSTYAPHVTSIQDGAWVRAFPRYTNVEISADIVQQVNQKVISIYGTISDPLVHALDGSLTISRLDDDFPPISWPVCDSHFKALVYLNPGPNKIRLDFASPKLANSSTSNPIHSSYLTLHMIPMAHAPPLHLVILLARDSPETFDAPLARIEREGNGLDVATRKFRMAAYLWQAFTAEQMWRHKMGRRAFRFDEEWQTGTSNQRDWQLGTMRNEAKVHIVRTNKTVAEIRDGERAQQNPHAKQAGDLFSIAADAVQDYFRPRPGQKQHVSVLILDSHWDKEANLIRGHAALGGSRGDLRLAIFGSQALHSYPSCFEEIVPAFTDCSRTDTSYVANDCNESGSNWEAANIGVGAHLHETGHLFGCPHQESGVMLRDYVKFNRSFVTREAYSTRTGAKGGLVLQGDECTWHRLDCLRFRSHPCFRLPGDALPHADDALQIWPVENGNVLVTAPSGVAFAEIFAEADDVCHTWIEYGDGNGNGPIQRLVTLTELDLRSRLPENKAKSKMRLSIKSFGGGSQDIADFGSLASGSSRVKLSNGKMGFRGNKLGLSQMPGSAPQEIVFAGATDKWKLLTRVKVYHGGAVDGIEFCYEGDYSELFGKRGGTPGGSDFALDVRRGEQILGFFVRAGFWVDAIQILTTQGRKSPIFGNANSGSP
jgi:hypothetical protein